MDCTPTSRPPGSQPPLRPAGGTLQPNVTLVGDRLLKQALGHNNAFSDVWMNANIYGYTDYIYKEVNC